MSLPDNFTKSISAEEERFPSKSGSVFESRLVTPSSTKKYQPPTLQAITFQLISLTIALILNILRKTQQPIAILGFKIGLVGGIVPAECLIFVLMTYELAMRETWFRF